ncbi:MAG: sugar transferase [Acidimicrobiales bacterium]|nr:sugar transferase [Acidimicrobiales bacterium]MCB9372769.1 sugar transferase [Microthrixaceae bacterium]
MAVAEGPLVAISGHRDDAPRTVRRRRGPLSPWSLRVVADLAAALVGLAVLPSVGWANVAYAAGVFVTLGMVGTYRRHLALSSLSELPRLLLGAGIPLLVIGGLSPFIDLPGTLFDQVAVTGAAVVVGRTSTYAVIRTARRAGQLRENALIVGAGAVGIELARLLDEHPEYGLVPVGFIDDVPSQPGLDLLGGMADLEKVIHEHDVRRVLVAFGPRGEQELVATLRSTGLHDVELHVVPRFFELGFSPGGPDVEHVWGIPLFQVRRAALRAGAWKVKRIADVVVSATLLVVLAPLLGVLALSVRLSSPGPILFRQRRIGQHGHEIEVLKFRTLRVNTDADVTWSVDDDPRQTGIGKWLRRLSLDELPQLWNVLRGDMSLVGPRPERPHFVSRFSAQVTHYADRHRLPVGLTGLAQIHGLRGDTSIEERARFDNYYIEHWSPWEDMKVMIATVGVILRDAVRQSTRSDKPAKLRTERRSRRRAGGDRPPSA